MQSAAANTPPFWVKAIDSLLHQTFSPRRYDKTHTHTHAKTRSYKEIDHLDVLQCYRWQRESILQTTCGRTGTGHQKVIYFKMEPCLCNRVWLQKMTCPSKMISSRPSLAPTSQDSLATPALSTASAADLVNTLIVSSLATRQRTELLEQDQQHLKTICFLFDSTILTKPDQVARACACLVSFCSDLVGFWAT